MGPFILLKFRTAIGDYADDYGFSLPMPVSMHPEYFRSRLGIARCMRTFKNEDETGEKRNIIVPFVIPTDCKEWRDLRGYKRNVDPSTSLRFARDDKKRFSIDSSYNLFLYPRAKSAPVRTFFPSSCTLSS